MTSHAPPTPRRGVRRGIYLLPALFTVGNVLCGYLSLDASVGAEFDRAAMLIFLAAILDGLDGRVARFTHTTSAFGEQLDSLADVVSFGVAPAVLVYRWALVDFNRLGLLVSFLFMICGAARLARFNIQIHAVDKRYFVGLAIPAAAGTLSALIWALPDPLPTRELKGLFLPITALLAFLMVSTFKYRSFKDLDLKKRSAVLVPVVALILAGIAYKPDVALSILLPVYALSGPAAKAFSLLPSSRAREAARAKSATQQLIG